MWWELVINQILTVEAPENDLFQRTSSCAISGASSGSNCGSRRKKLHNRITVWLYRLHNSFCSFFSFLLHSQQLAGRACELILWCRGNLFNLFGNLLVQESTLLVVELSLTRAPIQSCSLANQALFKSLMALSLQKTQDFSWLAEQLLGRPKINQLVYLPHSDSNWKVDLNWSQAKTRQK